MKLNYLYIAILTYIPLLSFSQSKYNASTKVALISDLNYSRGINLKGSNSNDIETIKIVSPFGLANLDPTWTMAQWGSRYNLKEVEPIKDDDGVTYSNLGKSISFKRENETTQITMKIFGSKEYSKPRISGEDWPHLLLEQHFESPQLISKMEALNFNIDMKLLFSEMKLNPTEFNPDIHTTQFSIYLTVQNGNKESDGYGDFLWFGLHLYDYRYDVIEEYAAEDLGKEDASRKFIYCPASTEVFKDKMKEGDWIYISKDIIEIVNNAFTIAQQRGFLKNSSYDDMYITTTNIGWETPGTFDCALQYKNLKLTAILK